MKPPTKTVAAKPFSSDADQVGHLLKCRPKLRSRGDVCAHKKNLGEMEADITGEDNVMKVELFRTASTCLISEYIITQQSGIKEVDTTNSRNWDLRGKNGLILGQLTIFVCLGILENLRWQKVTCEVVPNSFVRDRIDSVLSDEAISAFGKGYAERAIEYAKQ